MRKVFNCSVASIAVALLLLTAATGDDAKKVPLDKVPKAIKDAVNGRFPDAELTSVEKEIEDGKVVFDVELKHKGRKYEMDIREDGTIFEIEMEVALKDVPEVITKAVLAKYPKATIKEVMEMYTVKGKEETLASYEATIETADKKKLEVVVSLDGKSVKNEAEEKAKDKK